MEFLQRLNKKAQRDKKRIIFPEGEEIRVLKAAESILKDDMLIPFLIGHPEAIAKKSKEENISLKGAEIIDRTSYSNIEKYTGLYCEIRKHKKIKEKDASRLINDNPVFYAALAVRSGDYDGFVAGAAITTRDVARAAIHCIGSYDDTRTVSSSTILVVPDKDMGSNGVFIYADAGIVPDPTAEQLCDIAISSARMGKMLLDDEPKVAMLSYSTKGSGGSTPSIKKVREATRLVSERAPDILIDGEIQIDCAVVPEVCKRKDPASKIKGRANIFIFPNLDAGNISYKLTERLAKAKAIGPVIQGIKKPASDLSRGCSSRDIVDAAAVTAILAQGN